jgi:chromosome segregation ATPase
MWPSKTTAKKPLTENKVVNNEPLKLFDRSDKVTDNYEVTDKLKSIQTDLNSMSNDIGSIQESIEDIESSIDKSSKQSVELSDEAKKSIDALYKSINELGALIAKQSENFTRLHNANEQYRIELRDKNKFIESLLMGTLKSKLVGVDTLQDVEAENTLLRQREQITEAMRREATDREKLLQHEIDTLKARPPVTVEVPVAMTTAQLLAAKRNGNCADKPKLPG